MALSPPTFKGRKGGESNSGVPEDRNSRLTVPSLPPNRQQVRERLALTGGPFTPPSLLPLTLQVRERLTLTGDPVTPPFTPRHRLRKDPLAQIDDGERVRDILKKDGINACLSLCVGGMVVHPELQ